MAVFLLSSIPYGARRRGTPELPATQHRHATLLVISMQLMRRFYSLMQQVSLVLPIQRAVKQLGSDSTIIFILQVIHADSLRFELLLLQIYLFL